MKKEKILITLLHPFTPRAVLYTGLLQTLAKDGHQITVLVPEEKVSFYKKSPFSEGLIFQPVPISEYNSAFIHKLKSFFEYGIYTNIKKFHAQDMYARDGKWLSNMLRHMEMNTMGRLCPLQNLLRMFFLFALRHTKTGVEKYVIDDTTLFFSTDIYNEYDLLFIETAHRKNIKTIGMVRSWDNNVSKILLPFIPDHILTQNEIQSNELEAVQGVSRAIITPIGIPYYEYYNKYTPISREVFMNTLGIPLDSKLILFSPAGNKFIEHDWHFCQIMSDAINNGELPPNTYILVRCHPWNTCNLDSFIQNGHFIIERPGVVVDTTSNESRAELDMDATNHLIDELTHVDVVVNILSSIVLDAAVIGTPVVTPQFEGFMENVPFLKSIHRFQTEENMETLLNIWNGSRPDNPKTFVQELKRILDGNTREDVEALKRIGDRYYNLQNTEKITTATERILNIISKN